ncbi:hypothetical protein T06_5514, partial [Trichinella sp. T6]
RGRGRKVTTDCNDRGDSPVTEAHTRQPQRKTWYIAINTTKKIFVILAPKDTSLECDFDKPRLSRLQQCSTMTHYHFVCHSDRLLIKDDISINHSYDNRRLYDFSLGNGNRPCCFAVFQRSEVIIARYFLHLSTRCKSSHHASGSSRSGQRCLQVLVERTWEG